MNVKFSLLTVVTLLGAVLSDAAPHRESKKFVVKSANNGNVSYDQNWWKTSVLYQIYPRSFKDSDNDGNGDLQGIIQKLDYLKDLGIDAIWLSPINKSPQVDGGYDISDYRDVDPMYGTLDDLRQLLDEAYKRNIKVLLDYVPNHTSTQHKWFQASLKRDPKYDDYYVWRNASYVDGERKPPNNWISWFYGSAWEWREERQQYYLHQFSISQADLNYRNPDVVEEMKDVLRYWLEFGVDGFRMDAVGTLFEDSLLRDEPESGNPGVGPDDPNYLKHIYMIRQPETFDMIYQWRKVLDEFSRKNNTYERIMVTEGDTGVLDQIELYCGSKDGSRLGAHFTFNFISFLNDLKNNFTSRDITFSIETWVQYMPSKYTYNWLLGNHDNRRVASRLGVENIDALNILVSILPGVQVTYQGEEIGQENGEVTCEEGNDPSAIRNCTTYDNVTRDFERTPFQWDNSTNAGFNLGAKPWLPVSEKYIQTNVANQNDPNLKSHYNIYKQMTKLKETYKNASFTEFVWGFSTSNIFSLQRDTEIIKYMYYFNIGDSDEELDNVYCTDCLTVVVTSGNSDYKIGDKFNSSQPMKPREAVLTIIEE